MSAEPSPSPTLRPHNLTLFSHGLATLSLVVTLPESHSPHTTLTFTPHTHHLNDILKTIIVFADNATVTSINYPLHDPNVAHSEQKQNLSIDSHDVILDLRHVLVRALSGHLRTKHLLRAVTDVSFEDHAMNRRLADALNREKSRVANAETPITIIISPKDDQPLHPYSNAVPSELTVRYAVESPVYKLTHRLILSASLDRTDPPTSPSEDDKVLLQAWAIINSPFPHDIHDISVSLISDRPEEIVGTGPGYGKPPLGTTHLKKLCFARRKGRGRQSNTADLSTGGCAPTAKGGGDESDDDSYGEMQAESTSFQVSDHSLIQTSPRKQLATSVQGMDVAEVGDLYGYRIPHRVTLRANESALLPVISREIEGSKVLVYAQDVHKRYALSVVRLLNSGEATVEKGPVSVYEEYLLAG